MMNKQTEALKMAIEALSQEEGWFEPDEAIQACKEALEQPAQEPVAWNEEEFNAIAYAYRSCPTHEVKMVSERYQDLVNYVLSIANTAPSFIGLSDDEIENILDKHYPDEFFEFARAIEQAHGIGGKND